ncbi:MAG TPA: Ig-like domain repeat protein [Vicinamibacterales bacterium]
MPRRRSIALGVFCFVLQAAAAFAQSSSPWTGIVADEARPNLPGWSQGGTSAGPRSISGDGRFVVFSSRLTHLVYGDTNNWNDVFLRDRQTGQLTRVSVATDGTQGNHDSSWPEISKNGRHIIFNSCASTFDGLDLCGLFVHDRELGTTVRVSVGPGEAQATYVTQQFFSLSAEGRFVVFAASFGGGYLDRQIFLRDRDTDGNGVFDEAGGAETTLISQAVVDLDVLYDFEEVAISGDARWIGYTAAANHDGTEIGVRMFVHDRSVGTTFRVDVPMVPGGIDTFGYASGPDFSDANHIAYASSTDNLAEGDTDGQPDIYVFNLLTGGNVPIELSHEGAPALHYEWSPAISGDGRYVAFTGVTVDEWWTNYTNVYAVDRQTGLSYEISVRGDGTRDDNAGAPAITADGSAIAFDAGADLIPYGAGYQGVFVATGVALAPSEIDVPAAGGTFDIDVTVPPGVAWALNTSGAWGVEFSQTSGVGPATVQATLWDNDSGEPQDYYLLLGSEQVILHHATRPDLYNVYPYEGPIEGGTEVQIYGLGFAPGATVMFDNVPATSVTVVDNTSILATTPPHQAGWVDVTITNPDGESARFEYGYLYRDATPPVVTHQIQGTLGANGWYVSDVTLTWTYEDPESTVFVNFCFTPYTQDWDGKSFFFCSVYSDGGETFAEIEIGRDTQPPTLAIAPWEPQTFALGTVVPIALACNDDTSGVVSCSSNQTGPNLDTSTVGAFEFSATAIDEAGHVTTRSTAYNVKMATALTIAPASGVYGGSTSLQATLTTGGAALPGKTVAFFIGNVPAGSATTNAAGVAIVNVPLAGRDAGQHPLHVEFAGDDTAFGAGMPGTLNIDKATPVLTWANPAPIVEGMGIDGLILNATSSVAGVFGYDPDEGTMLPAGTHTLTVQFAPFDATNYNTASKSVTLKVKGIPVITWPAPAPITYPYTVGAAQLNATANVAGTFVYSPPAGWWLPAGTHTLSVTFTPANQADYVPATASVTLEILKGTPDVSWVIDTGIYYGTPLSGTQLNATSPIPGTFTYDPPAGTVLPAGTHTLSVLFTPSSPDWNPRTVTRSFIVGKSSPSVLWNTPAPIQWGTPLGPQQQNATVYNNIPGTLTYSPPPGTILEIGQHWMTVAFRPTDTANYDTSSTYVSITVDYAQSALSWNNPAPITYPQSLQDAQLNATANVAGTFTYTPAFGTILSAGTHTLRVSFAPADPHYWGASKTVTIVVAKRTPAITWNAPAMIAYGTALSASQLNATSNVAGTFSYSPAPGTVLPAGNHTLSVTFTPTDAANNNSATATTTIEVGKAAPIVAWSNPAGITYGTALSATQLNATANVAGTFAYSPAEGAVLNAGTQTLSVTFTPDDAANYAPASGSVTIDIAKETPVLTWTNPAAITYGTALSATELNATASVAGAFSYSPAAGTVLNAGTHSLAVTFTPTDAANYAAASAAVSIVVDKAPSIVFWPSPGSITYGTALSATELNATANVPGTFAYSYPAGTVLGAGTHPMSVAFTPNDAANYTNALAIVGLTVTPAPLTVQANNETKVFGEALPAFTATGTGLVNGDSLASLSGTLAFSTAATSTSAPGSYAVTPGGVSSPNYTITFANGTLTVGKASTSVAMSTTPNPSNNNQVVQLRAVVSAVAPGAGTPTGIVEFREGTTLLGTATLVNGVATMNKSFKKGNHPLTATFTGSANFNGSSGSVTHQVP